MSKEEIIKICNEVALQMPKDFPVMDIGDLQSVAKFIQLLEKRLEEI